MAIFHIRKEVGRVMHVEIKVLEEVTDTYAVIYTNRIDEEVLQVVDMIGNTNGVITAIEEEKTIVLRMKDIYMIRVESNKAIRESYTNEAWYVYSAPKTSDGDYKVIYDQMVDLVRSAQAKIILSEDDSEFEKNYNEFIEQLNKIGVDGLAEYMTPKLVEARDMFLAAE